MTTNFMTITIDGIDVSKYSEYYVLNHITKKSEPKRSDAFTMTNINEIVQVEVPEIFVRFKYLPIDLYRTIFKATRKTEFRVDYYDQDYDMIRSNMFYVKDPSSLKPHAWGGKYYGFKEYELNLVCTMNPISTLSIEILDENNREIERPFFKTISKSDSGTRNIYLTVKLNDNNISSVVEIDFSNDLIKINTIANSNIQLKDGNIYTLNANVGFNLIKLDVSQLVYLGEYVMFMTIKDTEYGSSTISCILKVVE